MNTTTEVKERPMLFSTPMVIATLEDRKDITRRVQGLDAVNALVREVTLSSTYINSKGQLVAVFRDGFNFIECPCPYGKPGDILWVRETWGWVPTGKGEKIGYKATHDGPMHNKWKPSIHMPKAACRLKLEIVSIGVERLQDITEEDAKREGAPMYVPGHGVITQSDLNSDPGYYNFISYKMGFEHLWQSINGPDSWEANPFCWRIEFRKLPLS